MPKVKLTPQQYAHKRSVTIQAVTNALRKGYTLPSVTKIEKFSRFYLLTVNVDEKGNLK